MSEHLAWQLLVTRWIILFVLAFVVGIFANGITMLVKKDAEPYKGKGFWWIIFIGLTGLHIGGFLHYHSLPHWVLSVMAGFFTGLGGTLLLRWISDIITVKATRIATAVTIAAFVVVANFSPVEAILLDWFKNL